MQPESDLDPRSRHRVLRIPGDLPGIYLADDPVWACFPRFSTPTTDVLERPAETILDAVVEALAP
ncbi:hypothetical protein [Haloglomus irregulare]|uniref:hypothetical protein n=1 Tax=Haloglomus irregulare TaxID=2234134 RepID=UPI001EE249AA|nr:hypothetical protein [Haloglomus irregulare]